MSQLFKALNAENVLVSGTKPASIFPTFLQYHGVNTDESQIQSLNLYKFMSIKSLGFLLNSSKLYIDRISSWDDSYENYFLKEDIYVKSLKAKLNLKANCPDFFGQCWTSCPESDAMWRIYSYKKDGVRIQTSAKKLLDALYIDDTCMADIWIGNVEYHTQNALHRIAKQICKALPTYEICREFIPKSQFLKRKEFSHEKEFRVVKMLDSSESARWANHKRLAFDIDVNAFIDSYLLDPRLTDKEYKTMCKKLIKMGADPAKIRKSDLYAYSPVKITLP